MKYDTILVLDFGGQYCHLIGRRIRENSVYSEIVPYDIGPDEVRKICENLNVKGLILSGGPSSVYETNAPRIDARLLDIGLPILGLCYGHQIIAQISKGTVDSVCCKEYGTADIIVDKPVGVLKDLGKQERVWMWQVVNFFVLG